MLIQSAMNGTAAEVSTQVRLLGHAGCGVTELRVFEPQPMVAYADSERAAVDLVRQVQERAPGIYLGVQPRPCHLFDRAPNCWKPATAGHKTNCACDRDIEYITACFFDIDVLSEAREQGQPASNQELEWTRRTARILSCEDDLAGAATVCCSGNGHYVLVPIAPISVSSDAEALRFASFCRQLAERVSASAQGARLDPVYNLSRVMRLMGTVNCKGQPSPERPYRIAHFETEPVLDRSVALHYKIVNTEPSERRLAQSTVWETIRCDLAKIESCEFVLWCRRHPTEVTEPLWFALLTNLARLEGGPKLAHEISCLDPCRYDYQTTEALIQRIVRQSYGPTNCQTLTMLGFPCTRLGHCHARAPMYRTELFSIWKR